MKKIAVLAILFTTFSVLTAACQPTPTGGQATPIPVQQTSQPTAAPTTVSTQAMTPPPEPSSTRAPATGSIKGNLGYPSEVVPELHIVAFLVGTDTFFTTGTAFNETSYQLDGLVEGNYHVVAYTTGNGSFPAGLSGGYTQAARCGMGEGCTDHSLLDVAVKAGEVVENVNLIDWLIPLPPMPEPGQPVQGAITGILSYPSEFIPPMRVVAFRVGEDQVYSVNTEMNASSYVLPVPAGTYQVVAYVGGAEADAASMAAGYSQAVPCGLSVDCTDHSLIDVAVVQGSVTAGVDPGDYYAPEGAFPPLP